MSEPFSIQTHSAVRALENECNRLRAEIDQLFLQDWRKRLLGPKKMELKVAMEKRRQRLQRIEAEIYLIKNLESS